MQRVLAIYVRMLGARMFGDGQSGGQIANPGLPEKWPLKWCV